VTLSKEEITGAVDVRIDDPFGATSATVLLVSETASGSYVKLTGTALAPRMRQGARYRVTVEELPAGEKGG
jgi:hypothetical protein